MPRPTCGTARRPCQRGRARSAASARPRSPHEAVAYCEAKNDHSRQESRLSEREQIDEEGGRVVALRTSAASQIPNNIVEQDHRRIKRLVRPGLGFKSMSSARQIICGYEIFAMIRKGQVKRIPANDMGAQRTLIASLFAIAA